MASTKRVLIQATIISHAGYTYSTANKLHLTTLWSKNRCGGTSFAVTFLENNVNIIQPTNYFSVISTKLQERETQAIPEELGFLGTGRFVSVRDETCPAQCKFAFNFVIVVFISLAIIKLTNIRISKKN